MATRLSPVTIRELQHKRDTAHDEVSMPDQHYPEDLEEWKRTLAACDAVLADPTIETLSKHFPAIEELDDALTIMQAGLKSEPVDKRALHREIAALHRDIDAADQP